MSTKVQEVKMVKLPSGEINLIPVGKIKGVDNIKPAEKTKFWVYEKTNKGGSIYDPGIEDEVIVRELKPEDIEAVLANNAKCYVEVKSDGALCMPSNGLGFRMVVIHLTKPQQEEAA